MAPTNARKQMTRFSTFILAVVMISGGVSFAFAQQAQPRYVVSPFAPFFNFGNRSSGPIPRTVVDFQSSYAPGTIFIDTTERRLYLVTGRSQAIRYGIGVGRDGYGWAGALRVSAKREWPNWFPPAEMLARRPDLPRFMPGGLENPLGARALYLGATLYRIHGSKGGFFRLFPHDERRCYRSLQSGFGGRDRDCQVRCMSESRAPNCLAKEGRGISWRLDMGPPNFAGSSRSGGPIGQKSPLLLDSRSLPPAPLAG